MQSNSQLAAVQGSRGRAPIRGFGARQSQYTTRGVWAGRAKTPRTESTSQGLPSKSSPTSRGLMRQRAVEGVGEQFDRPVNLVAGRGPANRKTNCSCYLRRSQADGSEHLCHLIRGAI